MLERYIYAHKHRVLWKGYFLDIMLLLLAIYSWVSLSVKLCCTGRLSQKSQFGTWGCHARFSWPCSVPLIAVNLWKLRNRDYTRERLLTSLTFPHSHFQRFQRFWSGHWWSPIPLSLSLSPPLSPSLSLSSLLDWISHGTPAIAIYCRGIQGGVSRAPLLCIHPR